MKHCPSLMREYKNLLRNQKNKPKEKIPQKHLADWKRLLCQTKKLCTRSRDVLDLVRECLTAHFKVEWDRL